MAETNAKIHVLADETLGGIKREYVEVDRKSKVGEKIVIANRHPYDDRYENGDVFTVTGVLGDREGAVSGCRSSSFYHNEIGRICREEYHVLEPTDIVHIDGEHYVLTDRKAEVGEKIIVTSSDTFPEGFIAEVEYLDDFYEDSSFYLTKGIEGNFYLDSSDDLYRVLVPVEAAEDEPKPADPIDVIANLAQEVAELKRTVSRITDNLGWHEMGPGRIANLRNDVSDIKRDIASLEEQVDQNCAENEEAYDYLYEEMKRKVSDLETTVEHHERVNDRHRDEIDTLYKDKRTLGEELSRLKQDGNTQQPTGTSFADFCEGYIAYSKAMKEAQQ
ncbi:hypothetical protein [Bacillus velezensis]|uniref:hypothetical protein n=1 Tax=Bacillus velezensis TaxID=492670 RepID=UPI00387345DA